MKKITSIVLVSLFIVASSSFAMNPLPKLSGNIIPLFNGSSDANAVVKTISDTSKDVFDSALVQDEVVRFWAEEDFSYTVSADPTAVVATSHRIPAYTVIIMVINKGNNMAIIGTDNGSKFYLSK